MFKMKIFAVCLSAVLAVGILGMDTAAVHDAEAAGIPDTVSTPEETVSGIAVDTILPETGTITIIGEYMGTVEPGRQITVYPKAAGEVVAVHFNVGDFVSEGDILFEIDSTMLEYTIAQTEAAVAAGKARANQGVVTARTALDAFDRGVAEGHDATLRAAQNAIDGAQTGYENSDIAVDAAKSRRSQAKAGLDTAKKQRDDFVNGIPPLSMASSPTFQMPPVDSEAYNQILRQLDDAVKQAQAAYDQADLGVDQAMIARDSAKDGIGKAYEGLAAAEFSIEVQRKNLENSLRAAGLATNFEDQELNIERLISTLDDYKGIAPFSGIIDRRAIEPKTMAAPQAPAFVISDMSRILVSYKATRESREVMNIGDRVQIEDNGKMYRGTITEISTGVDMSGLFTVKAAIPNPPANLFTGITLRVYAAVQEAENALTLPLSALYYERGVPYVYIADGSTARKVPVEVGLYDSSSAQILSGIEPTDKIINTWSHNMTDGAAIIVVDAQ